MSGYASSVTDVREFSGAAGEHAELWSPAPGVLLTRVTGHGTAALTRFYIQEARQAIERHGKIQVFHDWSEVTSYSPEARDLIRAFGKTNSDERVLVRYLVSSKVLSMAIQTAGMVLGRDFESTTQRATFERWVAAATRAARSSLPPRAP